MPRPLWADFAVWYAASVVCTGSTKMLLSAGVLPASRWLTLSQLIIAAVIGQRHAPVFKVHTPVPYHNVGAL